MILYIRVNTSKIILIIFIPLTQPFFFCDCSLKLPPQLQLHCVQSRDMAVPLSITFMQFISKDMIYFFKIYLPRVRDGWAGHSKALPIGIRLSTYPVVHHLLFLAVVLNLLN